MHTWLRIAAVLLLATVSAAAQDFTTLPESGKLLGYVAAKEPGGWIVFGPGGFTVVQPVVLEGGKAIIWQGDAGEYAAVYFPSGAPGAIIQPIVTRVVLGKVTPPPPPTPPLTPLAAQVRDWATKLVPPESRVKCESVAQSLDSISAQMAARSLTEPAQIIAATRDANQAAVGELREAWLPFFEEVRKYLNTEAAAGRLATLAQHQAIWKDLAAGLRAVK